MLTVPPESYSEEFPRYEALEQAQAKLTGASFQKEANKTNKHQEKLSPRTRLPAVMLKSLPACIAMELVWTREDERCSQPPHEQVQKWQGICPSSCRSGSNRGHKSRST